MDKLNKVISSINYFTNSFCSVEFSFSKFELTKEMIQPWVDSAIEKINRIIAFYISILEVKDVASTLKVLVALQVICMLGNWIRGLTLLYTGMMIISDRLLI